MYVTKPQINLESSGQPSGFRGSARCLCAPPQPRGVSYGGSAEISMLALAYVGPLKAVVTVFGT